MIVKCEQCQTRFKIPDDKVTDKGVKVRCTKCSHTFRVTRDMAQPATSVNPTVGAAGADPFSRFGGPAEPQAPPRNPETAVPFDFGSLSPPGTSSPNIPAVQPYSPPAAQAVSSPFDFAAIARPSAAAAPAPAAFDFSNFTAPIAPAPVAPVAAVRAVAPQPPPPQALPAFDFSQVAPPAPAPIAFGMGGQSSAPMDQSPGFSGGGSADGFFAASDDGGGSLPVDGDAARAMFDMPAPAPALLDLPPPEPEAPSTSGRNVERVSLTKGGIPPALKAEALPPEDPPRRRTVVGIVVNVAIAAVLVLGLVVVGSAYLNEGKFSTEALSLEGLKNTFAPSVTFVANDVSNGLYETRAGRSVFFVRGEVINRSEAAVKVVVKAEIVEDSKVVRFGESWAGEPASPEEIFLIESTESLEALNRKVEKRALVVPAGASAAFVVPFTEYPPDLKGFRVRVSARAVAVNPTAANP